MEVNHYDVVGPPQPTLGDIRALAGLAGSWHTDFVLFGEIQVFFSISMLTIYPTMLAIHPSVTVWQYQAVQL